MTEPPALLTPEEWAIVNSQREITTTINKEVVKVGAVYLRPTTKIPVESNWSDSKYLDTNLQDWVDNELFRYSGVGFNLQQGWVDIDIDGDDTEYHRCIHQAMTHVGIDCRLAFGRRSAGVPKHYLIQLSEEEASSFEDFKRFEPKAVRVRGGRFFTEIRSGDSKSADAKQTVMPGSLYGSGTGYDISVWWTDRGRVAGAIGELTQTTPRIVAFNWILRAIAFGTILFIVKPEWNPGSRQNTALKFNGWLARLVDESAAMNASEQLSQEVWCPIDSDEVAESLIDMICNATGDEEAYMRKRSFKDARNKLGKNPDAKIPGWSAIRALLGEEAFLALRAVCIPGTDTNVLLKLIDRYIYNESDGRYLDRERHRNGQDFEFAAEDLYRRHKPEVIMLGGKPKEAFKSFEMSKMRLSVGQADLYPTNPPGEMFRVSRSHGVVSDEFEGDDAYLLFNTWRGWDRKPTRSINASVLRQCEEKLDTVLRWLTCDRIEQVEWIKDWLAWTIQHPGDKQQIAWVVVGGQGVGKSFIGTAFASAIFGSLWGMVSSKSIGERFSISPFLGKMFVFADEVKFKLGNAADEIKLLIRNVRSHGELKGIDARDYNLYARLMFASNNVNVRIGDANVVDRALFYTKAYTPEFMGTNQVKFNEWTLQHKPFFDEFGDFLKRVDVREHYMHLFNTREVDRHRIEDINHSSSRDPDIMLHNISGPRKIAKMIIESGKVLEDLDISTPFTEQEFLTAVGQLIQRLNENTKPIWVFDELNSLSMFEKVRVKNANKIRFKWMIGTLTEKFSEAIGIQLDRQFEFGPGDYGPNTNDGERIVHWKGNMRHKF